MKKLFTLWFLLLPFADYAQSGGKIAFRYDQTAPITVNGRVLLNPWAGGLNTPQYSTIRLNNDTRDDLVVFDRTTNKVSTFVAIDNPAGTGIAWQYAPEYETAFPAGLNSWLLLVDYDGDGRKDIFTNRNSGVAVYHNESQSGQVAFSLTVGSLITEGLSGYRFSLFVNSGDMPAITDYDDDGDIDIITFDADGNIPAYQQNMSVERTGNKGGLDFKRTGDLCWGHFRKEFCNDFTFGFQCDGSGRVGGLPERSPSANARPLHTGNTLTVVDTDGDGNKDLLFGFVSCENIARLRNGGPNTDKANFTGYDSLFPARNPILFPAFPVTFFEDVDGDGQKDLLASPNVNLNDGNVFDFRASGWFYKNTGTTQKPAFQLIQKDFLQSDMLDLGERAAPALADLDGDGDMDLLVGYGGVGVGKDYHAGLWQFENKGTTQHPAFVLVTTDYLGFQSLNLSNLVPAFADVDGNGSMDLIVTSSSDKSIRVVFNAAAKGAPVGYELAKAARWPAPDLMQIGELPTVADVDGDGKPDLLIGKNNGTIHYYQNTGTATAPVFQLKNQTFGGIPVDPSQYLNTPRSLVITDLNGDQKKELISADGTGKIRVYQFPQSPDQPLTLLDSLAAVGLPGTGLIATVADLDGDQLPDLLIGSSAGGVRYLKNTSEKIVVTGVVEEPVMPWAFPNPTERYLTIRSAYEGYVDVMTMSGETVMSAQLVKTGVNTQLDLGRFSDGIYIVRLQASDRNAGSHAVQTQKVVVWK